MAEVVIALVDDEGSSAAELFKAQAEKQAAESSLRTIGVMHNLLEALWEFCFRAGLLLLLVGVGQWLVSSLLNRQAEFEQGN